MRRNGYDSYRGRSRFRTVMKVLIGVLLVVLVLAVAALIWLEPYLGYPAGGIRINLPFFRREQPEETGGAPVVVTTPEVIPTPAPTPEPESSAAPAEGFEAEFAANPIDQRLEEDLMMASSSSLVLQAYDTAAGFWQDVIDTAYAQAEEALSTDEYAVVQQEQGDWEAALEPAVQEIRAQHGEDEMAAASAVVDFYKERAKSLCQSIYNATGALPQFPNTSGEAQG